VKWRFMLFEKSPPPLTAPESCAPLADWLTYCERLHPAQIELGLDRVRVVARRMGLDQGLGCPVITVAGTNGKGSTCAMLEAIFHAASYRVGLYTSPHLVHFEERCRLDSQSIDSATLVAALAVTERARCALDAQHTQPVSLTYFEFTTLAILQVFAQAGLDVVILEVGLGGRLDATNLIDTDCAIITSIDLDHQAFLGDTREAIGREKAGIMRTEKPVVVSDPMPPASVLDYATEIGADLWRVGTDFHFFGDQQQWAWATSGRRDSRRYSGLAYPALRGANQLVNAAGVLAALEALRPVLPVNAQAIRQGLALVELPGRFQIIPGQPTLVLDVAHNPHSVAALTANLDAQGYFPCTHAVVGAMADKDVEAMLTRVGPLVDRWYFTDLPTPRAATAQQLRYQRQTLGDAAGKGAVAGTYASPEQALQAATAVADPTDRIVIFGSFYTVGGVLLQGPPRLHAQHLPRS
jgi:dihydrofolate synthase/folylpolyglutamate synthase